MKNRIYSGKFDFISDDCSDELAEQFFRDIDFIDRNYEGVDPVDPIKMLGSYTYMITHEKDDIERRRKMHRRTYC